MWYAGQQSAGTSEYYGTQREGSDYYASQREGSELGTYVLDDDAESEAPYTIHSSPSASRCGARGAGSAWRRLGRQGVWEAPTGGLGGSEWARAAATERPAARPPRPAHHLQVRREAPRAACPRQARWSPEPPLLPRVPCRSIRRHVSL